MRKIKFGDLDFQDTLAYTNTFKNKWWYLKIYRRFFRRWKILPKKRSYVLYSRRRRNFYTI